MTVAFSFEGAPAAPRDAATVLVLREGPSGPQVFFVRRNAGANFMGGAYVFPGGRLDATDMDPAVPCDLSAEEAAARLGDDDPARARGLHVAALRECLEESGILLATAFVAPARVAALRGALAGRVPSLADLLLAHGVTLAASELVPFSRWVTPRAETRRFDARFFLARAAAQHDDATHDGSETVASEWLTADEALSRATRREIVIVPPTWRTLDAIRHARSVDEVIACAPASIEALEPDVVIERDAPCVVMPPAVRRNASGSGFSSLATKFLYDDGVWVPLDA